MQNSNKPHIKRIIQRCGCDKVLPLAVVYILYIVLHGHLSPGGGFQGGILTVAAVLLVYLGHGYENTKKAFNPNAAHPLEGVALMLYIFIAMTGIFFGIRFCQNVFAHQGSIGDLFSSGTVFWMGGAVAFDVITASIVLTIGMLSVLFPQDIDSVKAASAKQEGAKDDSEDDSLMM